MAILVTNSDIKAGYRSDHSIIEMDILLYSLENTKGFGNLTKVSLAI